MVEKSAPADLQADQMEKVYEVFIDSFAGASGGVIAQLLFYPLENCRTRFQAMNTN